MSGRELLEKIKAIEDCGTKLTTQANVCLMQRQHVMYENEKDVARMMISSRRSQDRGFITLARRVGDIDIEANLNREFEKLNATAQSLNQCLAFLRACPSPTIDPGSGMKYLQSGNITGGVEQRSGRKMSPAADIGNQLNLSQLTALQDKLNVEHHADYSMIDVSSQLRLILTLSLTSQDRAVALILSSKLEHWLTSRSSCALLVNGQMFGYDSEARQSPLSYVSAKLIEGILSSSSNTRMDRRGPMFVMHWFCGQHTNIQTDPDAHPSGMLNNMLSQLIRQLLPWASQMRLGFIVASNDELELVDLCKLLAQFIENLPTGAVMFCIIDGISYYENAERQAECLEVISILADFTSQRHDATDGALIKLLVTAPLRSHLVHQLFDSEEVLNMDEHYPSRGGFSALQWDIGIGRVINNNGIE